MSEEDKSKFGKRDLKQWSRRKFVTTLAASSGLGLSAQVLVACSDDATSTPVATTTASATSPKANSTASVKSSSAGQVVASGPDSAGYLNLGPFSSYTTLKEPKPIALEDGNVGYIYYQNQLYIFSNICTHQGCTVGYDPNSKSFKCPCHGSVYDATGMVTHGPAKERLPFFSYKIVDNVLYAKAG